MTARRTDERYTCRGASRSTGSAAQSRSAASTYLPTIALRHWAWKSVLSIGVACLRATFAASAIVEVGGIRLMMQPATPLAG